MKKIIIILCAISLIAQIAIAQKTEISVKEGKVMAHTSTGSATVKQGQMAVLTPGDEPYVNINNPFVKDVLQMQQWAKKEMDSGEQRIDRIGVIACRIDDVHNVTGAALMEVPNYKNQPSSEFSMGQTSILRNLRVYDMNGTTINYKLEKKSETHGYYYLQFPYQVKPGDKFRFIAISKDNYFQQHFKQTNEGWEFWGANNGPNILNYWKFILPESAVFLKSEPSPIIIDEVDGRVAIILRHYTSQRGNGLVKIYFHWPTKDELLLSDLPWLDAGDEAVKLYDYFLKENIQTAELWGELGIKLIGSRFWDEAFETFVKCHELSKNDIWKFTSLVWQGHIYDFWGNRQNAIERYHAALDVSTKVVMRHDQWGMVISKYWTQKRLEKPFTENLLVTEQSLIDSLDRDPNELLALKERFNNLPWDNAGPEAVEIYHELKELDLDYEPLGAGWFIMGVKLVGGGYYKEAFDCFKRCKELTSNPTDIRSALIWQGHMLDIWDRRDEALEKYHSANDVTSAGHMRHDQWGIVLDEDWVKARLETSFTKEMIGK